MGATIMARRIIPLYDTDFLENHWGSLDIPAGTYNKVTALPLPANYNIQRMELYINDISIEAKFAPFSAAVVWNFTPNFYSKTDIPKVYYFDASGNLVFVAHSQTAIPTPVDPGGGGDGGGGKDPPPRIPPDDTLYFLHKLNDIPHGDATTYLPHMCLNPTTGDYSYRSRNWVTGDWNLRGVVQFLGTFNGIRVFLGVIPQFPFLYQFPKPYFWTNSDWNLTYGDGGMLELEAEFMVIDTGGTMDINGQVCNEGPDGRVICRPVHVIHPRTHGIFFRQGILIGAYNPSNHRAAVKLFNPAWKWYNHFLSIIRFNTDNLTDSQYLSLRPLTDTEIAIWANTNLRNVPNTNATISDYFLRSGIDIRTANGPSLITPPRWASRFTDWWKYPFWGALMDTAYNQNINSPCASEMSSSGG